jgi:hypothetical protein
MNALDIDENRRQTERDWKRPLPGPPHFVEEGISASSMPHEKSAVGCDEVRRQ